MTIRDEIKRSLQIKKPATDNSSLTASLIFPPSFTGFRGHFPGHPVVPGLCMVQAVLAVYETSLHAHVKLLEIVSAKFFKVIRPGDPVVLTVDDVKPSSDAASIKATLVSPAQDVMARMTLRLKLKDSP